MSSIFGGSPISWGEQLYDHFTSNKPSGSSKNQLFWAYRNTSIATGSDPTKTGDWNALSTMFTYAGATLSFDCGGTGAEICSCPEDPQKFTATVKAPDLFAYSWANGQVISAQSVDAPTVKNQLRNLVRRPWTWDPPGGLFIVPAGSRDVYPVRFTTPGTNKNVPDDLYPADSTWYLFETIMQIDDPQGDFDINSWSASQTDVTLTHTFDELQPYYYYTDKGGAQHTVKIFSDKCAGISRRDAYGVWEELADQGSVNSSLTTQISAGQLPPTSILMKIQSSISLGGVHNRSLMTEWLEELKDKHPSITVPIIKGDEADAVVYAVYNGETGGDTIANIISDFQRGNFSVTLDLSKIPVDSAQRGPAELTFDLDVTVYMMGGGWVINMKQGPTSQTTGLSYTFSLITPGGGFSAGSTWSAIDWSTEIGSISSSIPTGGAKFECSVDAGGTYATPLVDATGSCATSTNNAFVSYEQDTYKIMSRFQTSVVSALNSQAGTISNILNLIAKVKSSPGWKFQEEKHAALNTFEGNLNNIQTVVNGIKASMGSILPDIFSKSPKDLALEICSQSKTVDQVSKIHFQIQSAYSELKDIFVGVRALFGSIPSIDDAQFTGGTFDLKTALGNIEDSLTKLNYSMDTEGSAAADASGGTTDNPTTDDGVDTSTTGSSSDATAGASSGSASTGKGLSTSSIIYISLGALLLVVGGVGLYYYRRGKQQKNP